MSKLTAAFRISSPERGTLVVGSVDEQEVCWWTPDGGHTGFIHIAGFSFDKETMQVAWITEQGKLIHQDVIRELPCPEGTHQMLFNQVSLKMPIGVS